MRRLSVLGSAAAALLLVLVPDAATRSAAGHYGLSLFGDLKYGPDFKHFDYVNPDAPKGGAMKFSAIGTFDTLNPFVIKGVPAAGIGQTFETLMAPSSDEPGSEYGLIAASAEVAPDKMSELFSLRPEAKFQDGSPITPDDVVWTFDTLRRQGNPMYRSYYADVDKAGPEGDHGVRFTFKTADNRELPVILGELPVLSKKYWADKDFSKTTLDAPLGSGPYKVSNVDPGRSITYQRVADYWGKDLPVNKGRYNVDSIRYDYYRDGTIALEAFKAGAYDIRRENTAKSWATGYEGPALSQGLIKKEAIPNKLPSGMQGLGFNLRRPLFQDPRVRQAIGYAFDFEWSNQNLFYGLYTRTRSYFDNSELAATGVPQGDELKILEPFRGKVPDEVFTKEFNPPKYDNQYTQRDGLRDGIKLLKDAGWTFKGEQLVNDQTGQSFEFEMVIDDPAFERILLPFAQSLKRMGIVANVRMVDNAQYEKRMETFDFDTTVISVGQSLSPGNEQRDYFGSESADEDGSRNYIGIKNPVVDALIDGLVHASDRKTLIAYCHALDRVLLYNYYVVPQYHLNAFWIAYWDKFRHPKVTPAYGLGVDSWWVDPTAAQKVEAQKSQTK